jgi:hypothetical protein
MNAIVKAFTGGPLYRSNHFRLLLHDLLSHRTYKAATMMLRQLHFSRLDLELHSRYDPDGKESVYECDRRLAKDVFPMMPLLEDRFLCSFQHIFAGAHFLRVYSSLVILRKVADLHAWRIIFLLHKEHDKYLCCILRVCCAKHTMSDRICLLMNQTFHASLVSAILHPCA